VINVRNEKDIKFYITHTNRFMEKDELKPIYEILTIKEFNDYELDVCEDYTPIYSNEDLEEFIITNDKHKEKIEKLLKIDIEPIINKEFLLNDSNKTKEKNRN
jgi:hypothetical protein